MVLHGAHRLADLKLNGVFLEEGYRQSGFKFRNLSITLLTFLSVLVFVIGKASDQA
jgi:hypothetical protein